MSWATTSGNGSPVTGYTVTAMPGGKTCTTTDATTCTVDGLTNGNAYTFIVAASNAIGYSPTSETSDQADPAAGAPHRPTAPTAVRGDGQAVVSWAATGGNGSPVTGYTVTAAPGGNTCTTTGTSCTVDGLTNGTTHTFTVTASEQHGYLSSFGALTRHHPGRCARPTHSTHGRPRRRPGSRVMGRTGGNGSPVNSYTVTSSPGAKTCATTGSTSRTVDGLSNATSYTFTVVAINAIGTSPASEASNAIIPVAVPASIPTTATPTPVPTPTTPAAATVPVRMRTPKVNIARREGSRELEVRPSPTAAPSPDTSST